MKRFNAICAIAMLICLSFVGCDSAKIEVGTENGTAYFHYSQTTPDIILKGESETKIDDASFFGKLRTAIDGKPSVDDVCNCDAIYNIRIDKYSFGLHTHGIMVSSPMGYGIKGVNVFTVECSEEEMNELFGIIESVLGTGNAVLGEMPKDTTLEFWITEDVKDQDWTGHDEIYGWMGAREFLGSAYKKNADADGSDQHPEHYVSYVITAWPDYADGGQFVTDITVTDPAVKAYGLSIASTFEEFDAVFEPLGYELSWGEGAIKTRVATKDGITFRLTRAVEDNPDVVPQIRISAEVTNREGIVF